MAMALYISGTDLCIKGSSVKSRVGTLGGLLVTDICKNIYRKKENTNLALGNAIVQFLHHEFLVHSFMTPLEYQT